MSGCIGSRCPALSGCTLPQRAGSCPAVSAHAVRLSPAVRSHSVPERVRLYRFTLSGSALLYASTACRIMSGCIGSRSPAPDLQQVHRFQCSGAVGGAVPVSDPVNWSTRGCKVRSENVTFRLILISLYLELQKNDRFPLGFQKLFRIFLEFLNEKTKQSRPNSEKSNRKTKRNKKAAPMNAEIIRHLKRL